MQNCIKCNIQKPLDEFYKQRRTKNGHRPICKICESLRKKQYYLDNKEEILQQQKDYYEENKEAVLLKSKIDRETFFERDYKLNMIHRARQRAKKKNIEFSITEEDIIIPEYCPALGIKLEIQKGLKVARKSSPSLDRIDVSKGYIPGNIQVISKLANTMKNAATLEELQLFSKWLQDLLTKFSKPDTIRTIINTAKGEQ